MVESRIKRIRKKVFEVGAGSVDKLKERSVWSIPGKCVEKREWLRMEPREHQYCRCDQRKRNPQRAIRCWVEGLLRMQQERKEFQ